MQRNFTPQGKPQDPGALDRKLHAEEMAKLAALLPVLGLRAVTIATLQKEAEKASAYSTAELVSLVRSVHRVLGIR